MNLVNKCTLLFMSNKHISTMFWETKNRLTNREEGWENFIEPCRGKRMGFKFLLSYFRSINVINVQS